MSQMALTLRLLMWSRLSMIPADRRCAGRAVADAVVGAAIAVDEGSTITW